MSDLVRKQEDRLSREATDILFIDGKFLEGQTITLEDGSTAIVQGANKCKYRKCSK